MLWTDNAFRQKTGHEATRRAFSLAGLCSLLMLPGERAAAEPPLATQDDVQEALTVLLEWIAAFQAADYGTQWTLTDPRIRHWHNRRRWLRLMRTAHERSGALLEAELQSAGPIDAGHLPCTEMGHCYHRDVQYVVFTFRTRYEIAAPGQPEFAVMARSDEGWRFGGGTFPDRPLGESAVILDEQTERRLVPRLLQNRRESSAPEAPPGG